MRPREKSLAPRSAQAALVAALDRRIKTEGVVSFPAAPALLEHYLRRLSAMFASTGKTFSRAERASLRGFLDAGHRILHIGAGSGRNTLALASTLFARAELARATRGLGLSRVSDESGYDYERAHQPADGWPPTSWFESWSRGFNCYRVTSGAPPIELRWLHYRKRAAKRGRA